MDYRREDADPWWSFLELLFYSLILAAPGDPGATGSFGSWTSLYLSFFPFEAENTTDVFHYLSKLF